MNTLAQPRPTSSKKKTVRLITPQAFWEAFKDLSRSTDRVLGSKRTKGDIFRALMKAHTVEKNVVLSEICLAPKSLLSIKEASRLAESILGNVSAFAAQFEDMQFQMLVDTSYFLYCSERTIDNKIGNKAVVSILLRK